MSSTVLSGRYRLESKLGSGGMSTVYLALDEVLDRPVAIKLLHREISEEADQLERFRREARAAARLSHPNLVGVIDAGEDDGRPYIVFEYVEGRTLKRRIHEEGRLPIDEAVAYAIEIGRGLTAAHARKLVHRDVKPQNVLIDPDGRARVTDFGIARSLEAKGLTATGRVVGTTDYVSPEQAMGDDVDERSDVYSLGVVLYEMLTGEVPFKAETQVGVAMKHVNVPMPDVQARRPEVSAAVAAVVDRATTKDPRDRYGTVAEMVRDLEQTLEVEAARRGGTTGEATSVLDSVPESRRRLGRRRMSGAGIAMAIVGIALIVAALIFGERQLDLGDDGSAGGGGGGTEIKLSSDAASEFDPEGDGQETGTEEQAIDSNPTGTAWSTEHYDTSDFGGLKDGAGLVIDAGSSVPAKSMVIRSLTSGYDAQIYEVNGSAPSELSGWGQRVATISDGGENETARLPGRSAKAFLIWITEAPPASDDPGRYQMEISDVRLIK